MHRESIPDLGKGAAHGVEGVRVHKLSHLVADRLRHQIVNCELKVGDSLPAENELLDAYKVSRPTLREALRILESEALIEVSRGSRTGPTVLGPSIDRVAQYASQVLVSRKTTLADVHAARAYLEPAVVRSLASRPQEAVVEQLRQSNERQSAALAAGNFEEVLVQINAFHESLVYLSGNESLMLIVGILHKISASVYSKVLTQGTLGNESRLVENMRKSVAGHARLVQLIAEAKADEAETFWRTYMERTLQFMQRTGIGSLRVTLDAL